MGYGPESDETYVSAYNTFLQTEAGKKLVPKFVTDLAQSSTLIRHDESSDDDDEDNISRQNIVQDDWILLQLNSHYTVSSSQTASDDFDWAQDARALLPEQVCLMD